MMPPGTSARASDPLGHYASAAIQLANHPQLGSAEHEAHMRARQAKMLDAVRSDRWRELAWADETTAAFIDLAHGARAVFDLGAEAGFYAALALHTSRNIRRLHLVEPDPVYASQLRDAFAAPERMHDGSRPEVTIHEAAASDAPGMLRLAKPRGVSATAAPVEGVAIEVPAITIDQLANHTTPELIKIDVEGAEAAVLAGAVRTLREHRPPVLLEYHPWADTIVPNTRERLRAMMHDVGYTMHRFQPDGRATPTDRVGGRLYLHPPGRALPPWCADTPGDL